MARRLNQAVGASDVSGGGHQVVTPAKNHAERLGKQPQQLTHGEWQGFLREQAIPEEGAT